MFLLLLLQSERPCGLLTQGAAPSSLYPGLWTDWPFRPHKPKCVQGLVKIGGRLSEAKVKTALGRGRGMTQNGSTAISFPKKKKTHEWCALNQRSLTNGRQGEKVNLILTHWLSHFLLLLLQSERPCGLFTQGAAPSSLYPGLWTDWPFRPPKPKCVQGLAMNRGGETNYFFRWKFIEDFYRNKKKAHLRGTPLYIYILLCAYFTHTFLLLII